METALSGPRICAPEDVEISSQPWVTGTRAQSYFGPVSIESTFRDVGEFELELQKSLGGLRAISADQGANYIVGFEMTIDLFNECGIVLKLVGTAAHLVPLFE